MSGSEPTTAEPLRVLPDDLTDPFGVHVTRELCGGRKGRRRTDRPLR